MRVEYGSYKPSLGMELRGGWKPRATWGKAAILRHAYKHCGADTTHVRVDGGLWARIK